MKSIAWNLFFCSLFLVLSCNDDDAEPFVPNPEEVITTLKYTLTPDGGGDTVELTFIDLDGDGGDEPTITVSPLKSNTTYTASLTLLNESVSPSEDITEEVAMEAEEHQVFFTISDLNLTFSYADTDANTQAIGLATEVVTGDASTGSLTVILRHEPNKSADGAAAGDASNAGGETDIEVIFDLEIKD